MQGLYIGLISGTSMDGVDCVLVDFMRDAPNVLATHSEPLPELLRDNLFEICQPGRNQLDHMGELDVETGRLFAAAVKRLLRKSSTQPGQIVAIGSHGQNIRHHPQAATPFTLQIGDPNTIAELTGITTVADFRRRDMAAGGEGAPLAPAFHNAVFRTEKHDRVILNIGGMANITLLPANAEKAAIGFDTGPGNVFMDGWATLNIKAPMDRNGAWAAEGKVDETLLKRLLKDDYFSRKPPKSTGREHFNMSWLNKILKRHKKRLIRKNVQATLCELTAVSITDAITRFAPHAREVLVCGGGVHNLSLMFRLQMLLDKINICSTDDHGIDPDWVEAIAFAWLAKQTIEMRPGNLPSVTGARHPVILGGIYQCQPGT